MLTAPPYKQQPMSYGTAKRQRGNGESSPNIVAMATVVCGDCGARFVINHRSAFQDAGLAERQVIWLKDHFVWDHIQENKHSGSIQLPSLPEGKGTTGSVLG